MATDPKDHPLHSVPEELPRPPGDLPPAPPPGESPAREVEDENADPVGAPQGNGWG